jgi:NTE family protein
MSSASMARGVSPFAALERCTLFEGIERSELPGIALQMRPRSFEPGAELCRAGGPGEEMFVIVDGIVQVFSEGSPGESPRAVAKQRRGEVVGATALYTGEPHPATVVASAPTEVLALERESFDELLRHHPSIPVNLSRILSRRLRRSYAEAAEERERGEAVGLLFSRSLAGAVEPAVEAARAASPRPVASLDTRSGFHEAVSQLDDLLERHGTVVVAARAEGRSASLLLDHVDRAVILVEEPSEAEPFVEATSLGRQRIELLLAPAGELGRDGGPSALPVVRTMAREGRDGPLPPHEIAWLGRHLSRTKLGLALGAGGAKGYAHVGALYALEEAGYVVDGVSGSSIGAIVGAYLALGMAAADIDRTLREAFNPEAVGEIFQLSLAGGSTGLDRITRIFRETTGERVFDDLSIPLTVMSVDLTDRAPAPIREGPIWEALLAATALAGMFPPYERAGHRMVDGLALVPVPTGAAYEDGADVVLSINLMPRETLPAWPGQQPPEAKESKRKGVRMLETILEVMDLSQLEDSVRHAELGDVVLHPRFGPASWRDFHLADLFLAAGREAAERQMPALRALATPQAAPAPT